MPVANVRRNAGHPWDGRAGFDLMTVDFESERERDEGVKAAEAKLWKPWIVGFNGAQGDKPSAVFYKPSGIKRPWEDGPGNPHPGCVNGEEIPRADPSSLSGAAPERPKG